MQLFTLTASEFVKSSAEISWYWRLCRQPGKIFAKDFVVRIDRSEPEYGVVADLYGRLRTEYAAGGDWRARQELALAGAGDWLARRVLGPEITSVLTDARPCTVLMSFPPEGVELGYLPVELARSNGRPLAGLGVSFVVDVGEQQTVGLGSGPLRVLGLFSLPSGQDGMNLRKERFELESLAGRLTSLGRAIDLVTLQYGTTRQSLVEQLESGDGWDVLHLSGHGRAGQFVLERSDGRADPVTAVELKDLLEPLRDRIRLLTLSSCESAEQTGDGKLARLGLSVPARPAADRVGADSTPLAAELAAELGCAVLGMRYPVAEQFAAAFARELYRLLFDAGQELPRARTSAVQNAAALPEAERAVLTVGVPAVFGASAIELRLSAPDKDERPAFTYQAIRLAAIPDQPPHFVGRGSAMARAGEVLAPGSGRATLLVQGMPGIGKTTLAEELIYVHSGNFRAFAWYTCEPDLDNSAGLAVALEAKIGGLDLGPLLTGSQAQARKRAAELTETLRRQRILAVIDNADAALTPGGQWRDDRFGLLIDAITGHTGYSRVVLATKRPFPAAVGSGHPHTEVLDPLSAAESALLADELPSLRILLNGDLRGVNRDSARELARGVLAATRGHPLLLSIADKRAGAPASLLPLLLAAERIWAGYPDSSRDENGYLAVLAAWRSVPGRDADQVR